MGQLSRGDRVIVSMRREPTYRDREPFWRGEIVGESRDGHGWIVRRDNYKCPTAYHKDFCTLEPGNMIRKIVRNYFFNDREVHEILIGHLRAKDIPAPEYVGDTPTTRWIKKKDGILVEWTDEGEIDLSPVTNGERA